jgi:2-oxoglutarate ferredoxin oxidoreductase subunit gamma
LIVLNRSLCRAADGVSAIAVNATELADELGDTRCANLIMLGAYLSRKPVVPPAAVEERIAEFLGPKGGRLVELNIKAMHTGMQQTPVDESPAKTRS